MFSTNIILIKDFPGHLAGYKATVVKTLYRGFGMEYIGIAWDKGFGGVDGGWYPSQFELYKKPGEQLEFSFMIEKD